MLGSSEYTFDGDLMTFAVPGEFDVNFYFDENIDVLDYTLVNIFIPVCPNTSFIENTPDPFLYDGLYVELPQLLYEFMDIDPDCLMTFHLLEE